MFVSTGPSGRVWVSHGDIDRMSYLDGSVGPDGKMVRTIPNPGEELKVLESESGELWSLYAHGIQKFEDGKWVEREIKGISNPYYQDVKRQMKPFLPAGKNELLYLLPDSLMIYDFALQKSEMILKVSETGLRRFNEMCASNDGGYWLSGEKGVGKIHLATAVRAAKWVQYTTQLCDLVDFIKPMEFGSEQLFVVGTDRQAGTKRQLAFDGKRWKDTGIQGSYLVRCWPGLDGSYWVWREKNNLQKVSKDLREVQDINISVLSGDFNDVAVEQGDVFWLATSHGLVRHAPTMWRTPPEVSEFDTRIHAIHEDKQGRLWFGAISHILLRKPSGNWISYAMPQNLTTQISCTQSICSLPDGRIAIGTLPYTDYLLVFNPENEQFEHVEYVTDDPGQPSQVRMGLIAPRTEGGIWVQTLGVSDTLESILQFYDGKTFRPYLDLNRDVVIRAPWYLYGDGGGDLWLGGTNKFDLALHKDGKNYQLPANEKTGLNGAFCILGNDDGTCWIGGRDKIVETDGTNWRVVRSGMDIIRSMIRDRDGSVWVASGTGLHRYRDGIWVTNTADDGLPNTAVFSLCQDASGRIWAGTVRGLSWYDPAVDKDPPQVVIPDGENLHNTAPDGNVRMIFKGADKWKQTAEDRLLYSWRLDEGTWSEFRPGNMATFNNLQQGEHEFQVRAIDSNMNLSRSATSYQFTVMMPWYREPGFQLIVGAGTSIILLLLGYAVYRHIHLERLVIVRTKDLHKANLELKQSVMQLEKASRLSTMGVLAGSITHEITRPVNAVKIIVDSMKLDLKHSQDAASAELTESVDAVSNQITRIAEIIKNVRAFWVAPESKTDETFNLAESVRQALSLIEHQVASRGVALNVELAPSPLSVHGKHIHMEQIVINLVVNALEAFESVNHGDKSITVMLRRVDGRAILEVADNGSGFNEGALEMIFDPILSQSQPGKGMGLGLAIVKKYIEEFGGRIQITNVHTGGASVKIELPLENNS